MTKRREPMTEPNRLPPEAEPTQEIERLRRDLAAALEREAAYLVEAEALRQSEARARARAEELWTVIEAIPAAVFITRDPEARRMEANRFCRELLGMGPGENVSKSAPEGEQPPFRIYRNGVEVPAEELPVQVAAARGIEVEGYEFEIRLADGRIRHLLGNAAPLSDAAGNRYGAVGAFIDVTPRVEAEQALRASDRRKDEFFGVLAHELRNPLAAIASAIQLIRMYSNGSDPVLDEAKSIADRQVRHITRLLDDLLDMTRIGRGKLELRRQTVDIAEVITQARDAVEPMLQDREHALTIDLPPQPLLLTGDPDRLTQVLTNILSNAARYTPAHGRIHVGAHAENGSVVLRVRDNGPGIAPDLLPRIFDLYEQGRPDRTKGGLGIGLSLVKGLVEMHGGTVEAHSGGPGNGSEFVVRLPALPGTRPSEDLDPANRRIPARRIMLVEDNEEFARMLSRLLEFEGHQVRVVHDGAAALETALAWAPEVVLLDLGLPGMDGAEVARTLREEPALSGTKLIALTGYGQEQDRERALRAGVSAYLTKPPDLAELRKALE